MSDAELSFDEGRAVERLMHFLSVEGVTGREELIAAEVVGWGSHRENPFQWYKWKPLSLQHAELQ